MLHIEWALSTVEGPVVGRVDGDNVDTAWRALTAAVSAALPSWGPEHAAAFARLYRAASSALSVGDQWDHRSPGVAVSVTRTG